MKYGEYGGQYISEILMEAVIELEETFTKLKEDRTFIESFQYYMKQYVGRENPLYYAENFSKKCGGAKVYLKREDLNHTGAHKINNAIGQALIAKHMGKEKVIAETGAGQHGVATATASALLGLKCKVFMGEEDMRRQKLNVFKMELLGTEVVPVTSGSRVLKDATNEALKYWAANIEDTHYIIGSAIGPAPYPKIVKYFQRIIGRETMAQHFEQEGKNPTAIIACVGGGSNAIGMFEPFIDLKEVKLFGIEASGKGIDSGEHACSINGGRIGILHGTKTYLLQDEDGQIEEAYSISAGLDYPGIGPEHSHLNDIGRVKYYPISDREALEAFDILCKCEGIIPALESAHAVAYALKLAPQMSPEETIVVNLSGRGDKDVETIKEYYDENN
ncbi:tryptophan synthase subunit beta [Fusibacter ferrireducens]|uniref:Tryptophan synthase beta chain n=1 Tax=Fusibacter ferrireducens TaxID=2785058 RepID=A0ABR9ZS60_9FIRM|nr:tryptophan synthase subunit beta [Fusibacter ferrireducens]MBF4692745.1 tryptophan synthase subunit beta [Fusibacter ferrireducens]